MQAHDNYDEFVVQIGPRIGDYYPVTVLRSPVGTGGNGRFPVRDFLHAAPGDQTITGGVGVTRDMEDVDAPVTLPPDRVGRELFEALFTGEINALFERSLGRMSANNRRLRVRLHLNVENESVAPLAALPWELMFRQDRRAFLAMSPETTFVRSLDVPIDLYEMKDVGGPLPVLFVMANPTRDLNLAAERTAIEAQLAAEAKAAGGKALLRAEFLEHATFAALEELLHRRDYAVIHFMGHGAISANGDGQLLFEDGRRSGRDIGELLKNEPATRLVTLNACNTAATSRAASADPFAGVATALVMAGVPAVIAMQFPVSDAAAIAFSARLYSEIGSGRSIEASVDSGRRKIKAMRPDQHEWATPVLFLRDPTLMPVSAAPRRPRGPTGDVIVPRIDDSDSGRDAGAKVPREPVVEPVTSAGTVPERLRPRTKPADASDKHNDGPPDRSPSKWKRYTLIGVAIVLLAVIADAIDSGAAGGSSPNETPIVDGGGSGAGTPSDESAPSGDSAPPAPAAFVPLNWNALGITVNLSAATLAGQALNGNTSQVLRVYAPIEFSVTGTLTKFPVPTCTSGDCPARLYVMLTSPHMPGADVCYPAAITRSGSLDWSGTIPVPSQSGFYTVQLAASPGEECRQNAPQFGSAVLANVFIP
jgi:hypothetical protein